MRKLISFFLGLALLTASSLPASAASTPQETLAASKQQYINEYVKVANDSIDRYFDARQAGVDTLPAQNDITIALKGDMNAEASLDGTLRIAYTLDKNALKGITRTTPVKELVGRLSGSLTVGVDANYTEKDEDPQHFAATMETYLDDSVLYARLKDASFAGVDSNYTKELVAAKDIGWTKLDIGALIQGDMTAEEAAEKLTLSNRDALAVLSLLNPFVTPGDQERTMVKSLVSDYIKSVYGNTPLMTYVGGDENSAQLSFGSSDAKRIVSANFAYLLRKYDDILGAAKVVMPYDPTVLTAPASVQEAREKILDTRKRVLAGIPEFAPLDVSAYFEDGTVAHLRALKTWVEGSGTYARNYHTDIRYYLNRSISPLDHSMVALFAMRGTGEADRTDVELKAFPVDASGDQTMTLKGTVPDYGNVMGSDGKYAKQKISATQFNAKMVVNIATSAVSLAMGDFGTDVLQMDTSFPVTRVQGNMSTTYDSSKDRAIGSVAITTTPASVLDVHGKYDGTSLKGAGELTADVKTATEEVHVSLAVDHAGAAAFPALVIPDAAKAGKTMEAALLELASPPVVDTSDTEENTDLTRQPVADGTKVTVVEFLDFNCPGCKTATSGAAEMANLPGVHFEIRHLPLAITGHETSTDAANAYECSVAQNEGPEMLTALFAKQGAFSADVFANLPQTAGIAAGNPAFDTAKYQKCVTDKEMASVVSRDNTAALKAGIGFAPAFVVDGVVLSLDQAQVAVNKKLGRSN